MWKAVTYVNSAVTLAALVVVAAVQIFRAHNSRKKALILTAPERDRAALVKDELRSFSVPTDGLSKKDKYNLLIQRMEIRDRHLRRISVGVFIIFSLCLITGLAAFALSRLSQPGLVTNRDSAPTPASSLANPKPSVGRSTLSPSPVHIQSDRSTPTQSVTDQSDANRQANLIGEDLESELQRQNLKSMLRQANNFVKANNSSADLQALSLYSTVIGKLSKRSRGQLHPGLVSEAAKADNSGNIRGAVLAYQSLFAEHMK